MRDQHPIMIPEGPQGATVPEPDAEGEVIQMNEADVQREFDRQAEEEAIESMTESVQANQALDGFDQWL